jgi:hypothetical protein
VREGGREGVREWEESKFKKDEGEKSYVYTIKRYFVSLTVCEICVITICEADKHVFIMF